jgi:hypothetical protein
MFAAVVESLEKPGKTINSLVKTKDTRDKIDEFMSASEAEHDQKLLAIMKSREDDDFYKICNYLLVNRISELNRDKYITLLFWVTWKSPATFLLYDGVRDEVASTIKAVQGNEDLNPKVLFEKLWLLEREDSKTVVTKIHDTFNEIGDRAKNTSTQVGNALFSRLSFRKVSESATQEIMAESPNVILAEDQGLIQDTMLMFEDMMTSYLLSDVNLLEFFLVEMIKNDENSMVPLIFRIWNKELQKLREKQIEPKIITILTCRLGLFLLQYGLLELQALSQDEKNQPILFDFMWFVTLMHKSDWHKKLDNAQKQRIKVGLDSVTNITSWASAEKAEEFSNIINSIILEVNKEEEFAAEVATDEELRRTTPAESNVLFSLEESDEDIATDFAVFTQEMNGINLESLLSAENRLKFPLLKKQGKVFELEVIYCVSQQYPGQNLDGLFAKLLNSDIGAPLVCAILGVNEYLEFNRQKRGCFFSKHGKTGEKAAQEAMNKLVNNVGDINSVDDIQTILSEAQGKKTSAHSRKTTFEKYSAIAQAIGTKEKPEVLFKQQSILIKLNTFFPEHTQHWQKIIEAPKDGAGNSLLLDVILKSMEYLEKSKSAGSHGKKAVRTLVGQLLTMENLTKSAIEEEVIKCYQGKTGYKRLGMFERPSRQDKEGSRAHYFSSLVSRQP